MSDIKILSKALRDYKKQGKSITKFEKDYNCIVQYNNFNYITGIVCNNMSSKTMIQLKYK